MAKYSIIRFYRSAGIRSRVIKTGLTLEEAQKHCQNPQTSSRTCTNNVGRRRTRQVGDWFDGYTEE